MPLFSAPSNITVTPREDYVMWDIDVSGCGKKDTVSAMPGVKVQKVVNGSTDIKNSILGGDPPMRIFEAGEYESNIRLIAINTQATKTIYWGTGDIHFTDRTTGISTDKVGINGTLSFRASQMSVFLKQGRLRVVTSDIKRDILVMLEKHAKEQFKAVVSPCRYAEFKDTERFLLSKLAYDIQYYLQEEMDAKEMGIELVSFDVSGILFPDEFINERDHLLGRAQGKSVPETVEKKDETTIFLETCADSAPRSPRRTRVVYCEKCGQENDDGSLVCQKCGKILKF